MHSMSQVVATPRRPSRIRRGPPREHIVKAGGEAVAEFTSKVSKAICMIT